MEVSRQQAIRMALIFEKKSREELEGRWSSLQGVAQSWATVMDRKFRKETPGHFYEAESEMYWFERGAYWKYRHYIEAQGIALENYVGDLDLEFYSEQIEELLESLLSSLEEGRVRYRVKLGKWNGDIASIDVSKKGEGFLSKDEVELMMKEIFGEGFEKIFIRRSNLIEIEDIYLDYKVSVRLDPKRSEDVLRHFFSRPTEVISKSC